MRHYINIQLNKVSTYVVYQAGQPVFVRISPSPLLAKYLLDDVAVLSQTSRTPQVARRIPMPMIGAPRQANFWKLC